MVYTLPRLISKRRPKLSEYQGKFRLFNSDSFMHMGAKYWKILPLTGLHDSTRILFFALLTYCPGLVRMSYISSLSFLSGESTITVIWFLVPASESKYWTDAKYYRQKCWARIQIQRSVSEARYLTFLIGNISNYDNS